MTSQEGEGGGRRRTDSREKKWVTRKKCKMGDRVQTVYRIEGQMQKELRWQRKRIKGG